jgi:hypothetical protein
MRPRAKDVAQGVGVTTQLGLFEILATAPEEPSERSREKPDVDGKHAGAASSARARALRAARDGRDGLPRLCVKPEEAAHMLGVSRDYFDEHVKPELRIIRHGSRMVLVPVAELVRWVERNAARWTA